VKELLDIDKPVIEVIEPFMKVVKPSSKVIEPRLHTIETVFYGSESLFGRNHGLLMILRCQTANEMVMLVMFPGASHEVWDAICIACVAYEKII
jgi:hypothetical protein